METLKILEDARCNISKEDISLFLWYNSEFCIQVIKNFNETKNELSSELEKIIAPFIKEMIDNCDTNLL